MATLPDFVKFKMAGASMEPTKVIERSEMERGVQRTRRTNSDAVHTLTATMVFYSKAEMLAFESWYYSRAGADAGAAWVTWNDQCSGTTRQIRFVSLGALVNFFGDYELSEWQCTIEWIRSAY